MAFIRVMFIGHGPDDLARDRVVNTFHFSSEGTYAADAGTALTLVQEFYIGANSGVDPVGSYLSPWVQRAAELRAYDLSQPPIRVPTIQALTLPAVGSTAGLPEEVGCCVSYHGALGLGNNARRRGRIYIGPLHQNAMNAGSATDFSHPAGNFVSALAQAGTRLISTSQAADCPWCVRSTKPSENFVVIDDGYIDNAWDTQRRRGPDTTARVPFAQRDHSWIALLPPSGVRYFRTDRNGPAVFAIGANLDVWRIGPYQGAIAEAASAWGEEGILLISVAADVADWLAQLP